MKAWAQIAQYARELLDEMAHGEAPDGFKIGIIARIAMEQLALEQMEDGHG